MSSLKEELREIKEVIREKKKELDKLWLEANLALKRLKNYLDFYKGEKVLSDEELRDLKKPMGSLARLIRPERRRAGRIAKLVEVIRRRQRNVKELKKRSGRDKRKKNE